MKKYILKYKKSDGIKHDIHPSWYELCEKQTKVDVVNILKKHLYEPDEYTLHFRTFKVKGPIRRKKNQNFFSGWLTRKDDKIVGGAMSVGEVHLDYFDDTIGNYDFKNTWPEIDCEAELTNPTAKFTVVGEDFMPSPKEFEISCEKSAERFIKKLHKSVNFPLEIACDYPDVVFEICYDNIPDKNLTADTLKVVEEYIIKYNKRHEDGIHYAADASDFIKNKKSNAVYVHVDFGNCNIEALALVIRAIGKNNLPIKEMTLL